MMLNHLHLNPIAEVVLLHLRGKKELQLLVRIPFLSIPILQDCQVIIANILQQHQAVGILLSSCYHPPLTHAANSLYLTTSYHGSTVCSNWSTNLRNATQSCYKLGLSSTVVRWCIGSDGPCELPTDASHVLLSALSARWKHGAAARTATAAPERSKACCRIYQSNATQNVLAPPTYHIGQSGDSNEPYESYFQCLLRNTIYRPSFGFGRYNID